MSKLSLKKTGKIEDIFWYNPSEPDPDCYGYIYVDINLINGKRYVGQHNKEVGCRWKGTIKSAIEEYGYNKHLIGAMETYREENFIRVIIDSAKDKKEYDEKEIKWIAKYKSFRYWSEQKESYVYDGRYGYNMTEGGDGGNGWRLCKTPEELKEIRERQAESLSKTIANKTSEEKKEIEEKRLKTREEWTPDQKKNNSDTLKNVWVNRTPKQRKKALKKRRETIELQTPEEKEKATKNRKEKYFKKTPEQMKEICKNIGEGAKKGMAKMTFEQKKEAEEKRKKTRERRTPEKKEECRKIRSEASRKGWINMTPERKEERSRNISKVAKKRFANMTPEEKEERSRNISKWRKETVIIKNKEYEEARIKNDYDNMKCSDLYELAKKRKIKNFGGMNKQELIDAHKKFDKIKENMEVINRDVKEILV